MTQLNNLIPESLIHLTTGGASGEFDALPPQPTLANFKVQADPQFAGVARASGVEESRHSPEGQRDPASPNILDILSSQSAHHRGELLKCKLMQLGEGLQNHVDSLDTVDDLTDVLEAFHPDHAFQQSSEISVSTDVWDFDSILQEIEGLQDLCDQLAVSTHPKESATPDCLEPGSITELGLPAEGRARSDGISSADLSQARANREDRLSHFSIADLLKLRFGFNSFDADNLSSRLRFNLHNCQTHLKADLEDIALAGQITSADVPRKGHRTEVEQVKNQILDLMYRRASARETMSQAGIEPEVASDAMWNCDREQLKTLESLLKRKGADAAAVYHGLAQDNEIQRHAATTFTPEQTCRDLLISKMGFSRKEAAKLSHRLASDPGRDICAVEKELALITSKPGFAKTPIPYRIGRKSTYVKEILNQRENVRSWLKELGCKDEDYVQHYLDSFDSLKQLKKTSEKQIALDHVHFQIERRRSSQQSLLPSVPNVSEDSVPEQVTIQINHARRNSISASDDMYYSPDEVIQRSGLEEAIDDDEELSISSLPRLPDAIEDEDEDDDLFDPYYGPA